MDVPLIENSNTMSLIAWVLGLSGGTFAEKCEEAICELDERMISLAPTDEYHRLLRAKGQLAGFIRHDRDTFVAWDESRHSMAA